MNGDCVIDASALVMALVGKTDAAGVLSQRLSTMHLHAPHLIDAEVGNVLRRHERGGRISVREARSALEACQLVVAHRHPHDGSLVAEAWAMRDNLSFYDALYVALAERLGVPLITADARISRAPQLRCQVELV